MAGILSERLNGLDELGFLSADELASLKDTDRYGHKVYPVLIKSTLLCEDKMIRKVLYELFSLAVAKSMQSLQELEDQLVARFLNYYQLVADMDYSFVNDSNHQFEGRKKIKEELWEILILGPNADLDKFSGLLENEEEVVFTKNRLASYFEGLRTYWLDMIYFQSLIQARDPNFEGFPEMEKFHKIDRIDSMLAKLGREETETEAKLIRALNEDIKGNGKLCPLEIKCLQKCYINPALYSNIAAKNINFQQEIIDLYEEQAKVAEKQMIESLKNGHLHDSETSRLLQRAFDTSDGYLSIKYEFTHNKLKSFVLSLESSEQVRQVINRLLESATESSVGVIEEMFKELNENVEVKRKLLEIAIEYISILDKVQKNEKRLSTVAQEIHDQYNKVSCKNLCCLGKSEQDNESCCGDDVDESSISDADCSESCCQEDNCCKNDGSCNDGVCGDGACVDGKCGMAACCGDEDGEEKNCCGGGCCGSSEPSPIPDLEPLLAALTKVQV